jgi:hydrogenase nickel incorporation protein HypA/HybF
MHELSICQALIEQLEGIAAQHPGKRIAEVHVGIGPLSGVVPQLLAAAFSVARAGSCAQAADLRIRESGIVVSCPSCGSQGAATVNRLACPECGEWRTELVTGDELLLERVELDVMEQPLHAIP